MAGIKIFRCWGDNMVVLKSEAELARMRSAGRVVAQTLQAVSVAAIPGVRLGELDALAADCIRAAGAKPSFLHYHPGWAPTPFPAVLCLSVNDVIVHGIPDGRRLREGDLLSIDCGAEIDGYHGDAAVTVPIGAMDQNALRLMEVTRQALEAGIAAAVPGNRIGDISHAVETVARTAGYGTPDGFGGHGIGTAMHEDPAVPNSGRPGRGMRLSAGLVLAIEPMLCEGGGDGHRMLRDGWGVATVGGGRAAHFEHTVAITQDGPMILTRP
jgi:methionyl aminopeptidase